MSVKSGTGQDRLEEKYFGRFLRAFLPIQILFTLTTFTFGMVRGTFLLSLSLIFTCCFYHIADLLSMHISV
jgi:hypothetical protein